MQGDIGTMRGGAGDTGSMRGGAGCRGEQEEAQGTQGAERRRRGHRDRRSARGARGTLVTRTRRSTEPKEAEGRGQGATSLRRSWGRGPGLGVCLSLMREGTCPLEAQEEELTWGGFQI